MKRAAFCARHEKLEQALLFPHQRGGIHLNRSIALISEHASPLAAVGGIDAGGQNIYVASLARELGRLGYDVDGVTRRESAGRPGVVDYARGVRVINVPAGPPSYVRKEEMLPLMDPFCDYVC